MKSLISFGIKNRAGIQEDVGDITEEKNYFTKRKNITYCY